MIKEFTLREANSFLSELTPFKKGGKNENGRFFVVVVVLLFYVHGKHLRSCREGQFTLPHFSWAGLDLLSLIEAILMNTHNIPFSICIKKNHPKFPQICSH